MDLGAYSKACYWAVFPYSVECVRRGAGQRVSAAVRGAIGTIWREAQPVLGESEGSTHLQNDWFMHILSCL